MTVLRPASCRASSAPDSFPARVEARPRVRPNVGGDLRSRRAAPPWLEVASHRGWLWRCRRGRRVSDGRCSARGVQHGLARPTLGPRLWVQPQVLQDLLDHRALKDGRDDLQIAGTAVRAGVHVDVKDALEKSCPADAVGRGPNRLDFARGRGTSAANRCMHSSGLNTRSEVPSRQGVLSLSSTCPAALTCTLSSESPGRVM